MISLALAFTQRAETTCNVPLKEVKQEKNCYKNIKTGSNAVKRVACSFLHKMFLDDLFLCGLPRLSCEYMALLMIEMLPLSTCNLEYAL